MNNVVDNISDLIRSMLVYPFVGFENDRFTEPVGLIPHKEITIACRCTDVALHDAIMAEVTDHYRGRDVRLVNHGGIAGLISLEPLLQISIPGKKTLIFRNVETEEVGNILAGAENYLTIAGNVFAQLKNSAGEIWPRVPFLEEMNSFRGQKRELLHLADIAGALDLPGYIRSGGFRGMAQALLSFSSEKVVEIIEQSGLIGRGSGSFLVSKKWQSVRRNVADQKYLICNLNEFGPHSLSGKILAETAPFQVLESCIIAAYAINAGKVILFVHTDYKEAIQTLNTAIDKARNAGLAGENILDSGINIYFQIVSAPGFMISGEETAMIRLIEGKRPVPRLKPPYPTEIGFLGKPTVIHNVETLCNLPMILSRGPEWFKSISPYSTQGTKLVTVSGRVREHGIYEVAAGTTFRDLIFKIAGGMTEGHQFKGMQFGGAAGFFFDDSVLDKPIDLKWLHEHDIYSGSSAVMVFSDQDCVVDLLTFYLGILAGQSCGKCIPCRNGSRVLYETIHSLTVKPQDKGKHELLERFKNIMTLGELTDTLRMTSFCNLGRNIPNPVGSVLKYFREELEEHIFDRNCRAHVCLGLRTFTINPDTCTHCGMCIVSCPVNAIILDNAKGYAIIENDCIGCGDCTSSCKFGAIQLND